MRTLTLSLFLCCTLSARRPTITNVASVTASMGTIWLNGKQITKGAKVVHRHVTKPIIKAVSGH